MWTRTVVSGVLASVLIAGSASGSTLSNAELTERLDAYLRSAETEGFSGAVLVARGGRILIEKGFGSANVVTGSKVSADTVFTTGSITKQFTAAAIMKLVTDGKLSVEDRITRHFDGGLLTRRGSR